MIWDDLIKDCEWSDRPFTSEEIAEVASMKVVEVLDKGTLQVLTKSGSVVYLGIEGPVVEPIDLSKATIRTYQKDMYGRKVKWHRVIL